MGELIFMVIIALIAIILFIVSGTFPVSIIDKSGGAAFFPRIVIILLLLFMLIRTAIILKNKNERVKPFIFFEMFKGQRLIYLLSTLSYILLIQSLGFIITTSMYLIGMSNFLYWKQKDLAISIRKNLIIMSLGILVSLGIYLFFTRILNILLPEGILPWL